MRKVWIRNYTFAGCLAAAMLAAPQSQAASITAQLTCSLNVLNTSCNNIGPYGTVKLDDSIGNGDLTITVTLGNSGQKFIDLMLAFGGAATSITENDPNNIVTLSANAFTIQPYLGAFDIGDVGNPTGTAQGWNGDSGYTAVLSGNADLLLTDFLNALDSNGKVSVALHIQNIGSTSGGDCDGSGTKAPCDPTMTGPGSLKIGGTFKRDDDVPPVPEPSTMLLMGGSLLALGYFRKRRNS
jgi:hypothetical protein